MPTSGNVPKHLEVGAQTGFLTSMRESAGRYPWQRLAMQMGIGAKSVDLVDLGAAPMPVESRGGPVGQDFIEKTKTVTPTDWELTTWISYNAVQDDQTGSLLRRCRQAGANFQRHINKRVFQVLNAGDGQTYGACYDGQDFFDSDHVDLGAAYSTNQDNENVLALSLDNFETVWNAAQLFRDDQGEYTEYAYDLLVCHTSLYRTARQIVENIWAYDTANQEMNVFADKLTAPLITNPNLDSTAWYLIASSEEIKPLLVVMREQPGLQESWFDATAANGGRYYFKFYGRYEVHYGDWRLASQGNT